MIQSIQQDGRIAQFTVGIGDIDSGVVEGHTDKYFGRLKGRDDMWFAWKRHTAALITP